MGRDADPPISHTSKDAQICPEALKARSAPQTWASVNRAELGYPAPTFPKLNGALIGAAWAHGDGKGFNLKLEYLPLNNAEIVIRTPKAAEAESAPGD
jgi:hypothetical protein